MSSSPEAHNGTMIQPNNPYRQPHAPRRTQWQARRAGATLYFGQFDQLILGEKPLFSYQSRSRRPPRRACH